MCGSAGLASGGIRKVTQRRLEDSHTIIVARGFKRQISVRELAPFHGPRPEEGNRFHEALSSGNNCTTFG